MLSSRLKALVIPTSQKTAIATPSTSFVTSSTRRPAAIAIPAAAICAASFASGLRWRTSSTTPATKSSPHPARIPASSHDASTAPTAIASATPAASPQAMPTPPNVGVARSCQRSPVGCATSLDAAEGARRRAQRANAATGRAAIVTAASTVAKG